MSNPLELIHNDDGSQPMAHVRLGQVKEDLEQWGNWIMDTPVDAYLGCTAHPEICYHDTKVGERYGSRPGQKFSSPSSWLRSRAHEELIAQKTDMLHVVADQVHKRGKVFLAGMRMSDAHHSFGVGYPDDPLFPKFTYDHAEYRIKNADGTLKVTLDYSHEAVRAHRLAILREIVCDYPVDGLELDFMRFCSHFPYPATKEQVEIMTGFIREIRKMIEECGRSQDHKGRMILGVRVPPTLSECAPNGLDPESWAREGLIDYLTPANFLWADFNIPVTDYLAAVNGTNCRVLFSIQPWTASSGSEETRKYHNAFTIELPEYRALAANGYAAGAHGLHAFNLCCELPGRLEDIIEAFQVMSDRKAIYSGLRHYQYFPSDPGGTVTGANHRQTLHFPFQSLNKSQAFRFQMADGIRKEKFAGRMAWRIYNAIQTDRWTFRLNGQVINPEKIRTPFRGAGFPVRVGAELPAHMYFEIDLQDAPPFTFRNELEITPAAFEREFTAERAMEVLEVWVKG